MSTGMATWEKLGKGLGKIWAKRWERGGKESGLGLVAQLSGTRGVSSVRDILEGTLSALLLQHDT